MKILSSIQEIISHKSINSIVYIDGLSFNKEKSSLARDLDIDFWSYIKDPPANDSAITNQDLDTVIRSTKARTQREIDLVYAVDKEPLDLFLPILLKHNLVFPKKVFATMYSILSDIVMDIKYAYNRPRPFQLAKYYGLSIDIIYTKTHRTPSYPSGHMAYACLLANTLSDYYPDHSKHFDEIADLCGTARVIQGVHFPSDNQASANLVKKLYPELKKKITN